MLNEENRFAPPEAAVADVLSMHRGIVGVDYEMRRLDYFLFLLIHQLRMPSLQLFFIGISCLAAMALNESVVSRAAALGVLAYITQWAVQSLFLAFTVLFKNKRLYTWHEVKPLDDSLAVLTQYARQYYYWQGLESVLVTPWFIAIYVNKHAAHVIPNRAFRGAEARRDLVKLVETMRHA